MSWGAIAWLIVVALILAFGVFMSDVVLQLRKDVQVIRRKVNLMTASPDPPNNKQ